MIFDMQSNHFIYISLTAILFGLLKYFKVFRLPQIVEQSNLDWSLHGGEIYKSKPIQAPKISPNLPIHDSPRAQQNGSRNKNKFNMQNALRFKTTKSSEMDPERTF